MPKPKCWPTRRLAFFDSCNLELKSWTYDLPSQLRAERVDATSLPQAYTLHMVYHATYILLAKPCVEAAENLAPSGTVAETFQGYDTYLNAKAVLHSSAKHICSVARRYRRSFGTFRRSPITATHCTLSAALVFLRSAKSSTSANDGFNTDDLILCLEVLAELSTSWDTARRIRLNLLRLMAKSSAAFQGHIELTQATQRTDWSADGSSVLDHDRAMQDPFAPPAFEGQPLDTGLTNSTWIDFGLEQSLETMINDSAMDFDWNAVWSNLPDTLFDDNYSQSGL